MAWGSHSLYSLLTPHLRPPLHSDWVLPGLEQVVHQAVVKQVLTDCEKYVMTIFNLLTLSEQGIFDVVSNLGSLAARFIFRPAEESAYFFFSQLWSRGTLIKEQDKENYQKVQSGLFRLLRMMLYLGKTQITLLQTLYLK